ARVPPPPFPPAPRFPPGRRAGPRTPSCRTRRPVISRRSISTRSCSRPTSSPSWCVSTAPTTSSWEPTIPSTWPTTIRSATSRPRTASTPRPSPRSPGAMPASCWESSGLFRPHASRHSLRSFLRMRARSLPLHLGVVDDFAPLRLVGLDVFRELLRRARDRFEILSLEEILLDVGIGEDLVHLGVDPGDDVRGHPGRTEQPEPR